MNTGLTNRPVFLLVLLGISLVFSCPTFAQFSVSERTFKKLSKVEKLMEKKSYQDALTLLENLKSSTKRKAELALVNQALGYLLYEKNDYKNAIANFQTSLKLNASPEPVLQNIRFNLAQLHAITDNYQEAIQYFEEWIKKESTPSGDRLALGGSLYAQIKQYDAAVKYLQKAIASTQKPQESWYRTLLSVYFQQENYQSASELLQRLIVLHPNNKEYWKQLYTSYYLLKNYSKALSTLEIAYTNNLLKDEDQITNLARLYLHQGAPIKAARLLNREISKNNLQKNNDNLQLLANAYQQSRELDKAADIYLQLARIEKNSELQLLAARLYMESRQWQNVIDALENLEIKPGKEQAHILKGMALVELGQKNKAIKEFNKAKKSADTSISANQWLEYLSTQN